MDRRINSLFWIASLMFLISGATGLAYEVIWFKRFAHVWGSSSVAMAAVVASFLAGLGVGAHIWGRFTDRLPRPLFWYGVCEIGIALLAITIPWEIEQLTGMAAVLTNLFPQSPLAQFGVRFAVTFLVLGPPCFLMGGTLPLLVRQCTSVDGSLSEATGLLYGVNTLGAALGCYITGFHILPALGLFNTNLLTAAVNATLGLIAVVVGGWLIAARPVERILSTDLETRSRERGVYLAVLLTGWSALMLQMVWARQLALILGGSTYAFSATLFVVLVAIAAGSLIYHLLLRPRQTWIPWAPTIIIVAICLAALAGERLLPGLANWLGTVRGARANPTTNGWICAVAGALIQFPAALGMGVLFPLYVQLTNRAAAEAGATVGNIYAWNTVGSLLGATLTSLVIIDLWGVHIALALSLALYLIALWITLPAWNPGGAPVGVLCTMLCGLLVFMIGQPTDPLDTNLGAFLYGPIQPKVKEQLQVLFYEEGPVCNVLVTELGAHRDLRVNGKVDASNDGPDMLTQLGTAYLPFVFKPDAREILVIGFGSGTSAGAALELPNTQVTCVEIEPAVLNASPQFHDVNHRPEFSNRYKAVVGDGRSYLQTSPTKFDLIISEPSNPWMAGIGALFTQEFFESAADHLADDGILLQWIQTYNFTAADYALVVRTLKTVFPYSAAFVLRGGDTFMLASRQPLVPDLQKVAAAQRIFDASPVITKDLEQFCGGRDIKYLLLSHFLFDTDRLSAVVAQDHADTINTDVNLRLEYDAPLRLFGGHGEITAEKRLAQEFDVNWLAQMAEQLEVDTNTVAYQQTIGNVLYNLQRPVEAVPYFAQAVALDPQRRSFYRAQGLDAAQRGDFALARLALDVVVQTAPDDVDARRNLAAILLRLKEDGAAVEHLRQLVQLQPDDTDLKNTFAWMIATHRDDSLRNGTEALDLAQSLCAQERRADWLDTLAAAQAEAGDFESAAQSAEEAAALAESSQRHDLASAIRKRLEQYRGHQPHREG
jgi:predicted membrane-bound spermidine synthase